MPAPSYNINPGTNAYSATYGGVPNPIGLPPNIYQQLSGQFPALNDATTSLTKNIGSELNGQLPSDVLQNIQNAGAAWGINSGSGANSGIAHNLTAKDLGLTTLDLNKQGTSDYLNFLSGAGQTMTPQSLYAEIASYNSQLASAPIPSAAAQELQGLAGGSTGNPIRNWGQPANQTGYVDTFGKFHVY